MSTFRPEVRKFIRVAETLFSPESFSNPLTKEEGRIAEFYATSLTEYCADVDRERA